MVVFPGTVTSLFVGRPSSVSALETALQSGSRIFLGTQQNPEIDDVVENDLFPTGCLAQVIQCVKLPDGAVKVVVQGLQRYRLRELTGENGCGIVSVTLVREKKAQGPEVLAVMRSVLDLFTEYVKLNPRLPQETVLSVSNIDRAGVLADQIASQSPLKVMEKQAVLEEADPVERLKQLAGLLTQEIEILRIEKKIRGEVRRQMERSQREYYLTEQIKAIQRELGRDGENAEEIEQYRAKIKKAGLSPEIREKAERELKRLAAMPPMSPEAAVTRNYLEWMVSLPWTRRTRDRLDIRTVRKVLNDDHFGLEKPKQRIVEFLAVRKLVDKLRGPILCFVGPPGVGKTSLGRSIARALRRRFVRISLGGVRDEAEIRGHRRTYVGALPGRIVQMMRKAGTVNPVFLLDEVDKMSTDFRGDPSAALLEVLDPELNSTFTDHYLEVEYDLSQVLFITTANLLDPVPAALKDRMEVIEIPSYTDFEKFRIARDFLVPKQIRANGLRGKGISFSKPSIETIIHSYTRESGVRQLEREIASVLRKQATKVAAGSAAKRIRVTPKLVETCLGPPKFLEGRKEAKDGVGVAMGLAWTEAGGKILPTEVAALPGTGILTLTGQLGDVMQESAKAALSFARSRSRELGLRPDFHRRKDIHVHVPEGAIPKDGPSAGVTLATAIISALTGRPVRSDLAMTGEVSLRGRVLSVGGVKEKVLAAHRATIRTVILPEENRRDLAEIPHEVQNDLNLVFVKDMDGVLGVALQETEA
jgi:ATP-dependent Lon protease